MAVRESIIAKASLCIDEVYPSPNDINAPFLPIEQFLDEAAEWVVKAVPAKSLGKGTEVDLPLEDDSWEYDIDEEGVGSVTLPEDFKRLLSFKCSDWRRPVVAPIYDTDISYTQQSNPYLRGNAYRPEVAICDGETRLEFYTATSPAATAKCRYFAFSTVDNDYPENLINITAWKLAELVLTSISSIISAQACQAKVNELLQLL